MHETWKGFCKGVACENELGRICIMSWMGGPYQLLNITIKKRCFHTKIVTQLQSVFEGSLDAVI
jgi:hypothetical protein